MHITFEAQFVRLMFLIWNANVQTWEELSLFWYVYGCVQVT
jgi:hypothetical protein